MRQGRAAPLIGKTISHYRILELLGEGGMGEVFKAEDTRLGRPVALKFIRQDAVGSDETKARFLREAQAAAVLDHPNICTIHAIHEWKGQLFLEMCYVEGQTLKDRISGRPLEPEEALGIARQVASGLEAAHAKGIVHRDIKSSNIMLSRDGRAQILDFGLARSAAQSNITRSGAVMGTAAYMSPEQARGQPVDHRTDIWSLGVVLYEMLTGEMPFRGEHEASVIYAILHEEPEPVTARCPKVPAGLERICRKAMAKTVQERYQRVSDLAGELDALRKGVDLEASTAAVRRGDERSCGPGRWGLPQTAGLVVVVAALAVGVWWLFFRSGREAPGHSIQVTGGGTLDFDPAVSPDGGRIVYASDRGGNTDIYLVDVHGNTAPRQLTDDPAPEYSPAWYPDGTAIAFVSERGGEPAIWKAGQFGEGATLLVPDAFYPAISPDGSRIAFSRAGEGRELRIVVAPLADPARAVVLTGREDGLWDHHHPAWAPDGRNICYSAQDGLWVVPSTGGRARPLTAGGVGDAYPCWSPPGDRVYFSSNREGKRALWSVGAGGGPPQRLPLSGGHEVHPSMSRDGRRLVYSTRTADYHVVLLDLVTGEEKELPDLQQSTMIAVAPDISSIVFVSERSRGDPELWLQPVARGLPAGKARRLTKQSGFPSQPAFSPDGKWVAYYRVIRQKRGQQRDIWTVPISGRRPVRFTRDPAQEIHPAWSPDGSQLAFVSDQGGSSDLWIAPVRKGKPAGPARRLTGANVAAFAPSWSPDGALLAFVGSYNNRSEVWVVPADGSADPRRVTTGAGAMRVRWQGSTGAMIVSGAWGEDRYTLRRVYLDGREPAGFSPPIVLGSDIEFALFDVSADGHLLVRSREEDVKEAIWVLEAEAGIR